MSNIVAVDNGPIALPIPNDFKKYMEGLAEVEQAQVPTHAEGERILAKFEEASKVFFFFPFFFQSAYDACWYLADYLTVPSCTTISAEQLYQG